jgi:TPP-dependent pyruvate/acetoin dehydrogenase alpha subunit
MYRIMVTSRRYVEQTTAWYKEGRIQQALHPSTGQEAIGVGACYGLRPDDWVVPSLRTTEAYWTRGVTLLEHLNAMMGNAASVSRGKETAHHSGYPDRGILASSGVVGASTAVAVGMAYALRMQGADNVVLCFFGDGSAAQGAVHEAMNMAAVLQVPVVFGCENNHYGQTVPEEASRAIDDIATRAQGYGFPGEVVDGQDVVAVYEATQAAVARARRGGGATLLEFKTNRFKPHYPSFPEVRSDEHLEQIKKRDPIRLLERRLKAEGLLDEKTIGQIEEEIEDELEQAIQQAEKQPLPEPEEVFVNVYAESVKDMSL